MFQEIILTESKVEREKVYLSGITTYGLLFLHGLAWMVTQSLRMLDDPAVDESQRAGVESHQEILHIIADEAHDVFLDWLSGARSSERADDVERRAEAGRMVLGSNQFLGLSRVAARFALAESPLCHNRERPPRLGLEQQSFFLF
jgi:hypothetical protein